MCNVCTAKSITSCWYFDNICLLRASNSEWTGRNIICGECAALSNSPGTTFGFGFLYFNFFLRPFSYKFCTRVGNYPIESPSEESDGNVFSIGSASS